MIADRFQDHAGADRANDFVDRKTRLAPAQPPVDDLPVFGFAAFDLRRQPEQILLQCLTGVVHRVAHLHGRALGADTGEGQIYRGVRRAHTNLALRQVQGL